MKGILELHRRYFNDKIFVTSLLWSILFLVSTLVIHFFAITYATDSASNSVTDIVLSNTRVYNVNTAFIYGPLIIWIMALCFGLMRPNQIPFVFKTISIFILVRSVFINLTHLGPFPTETIISPESYINYFASGGDLFFSAHTGLAFLLALVFWKSMPLRWLFIFWSVFFGVVVLLGHLHYTIDVLSAFFITYTIYHLAELTFKRDKIVFDQESMII
jgi:hypothetical protein